MIKEIKYNRTVGRLDIFLNSLIRYDVNVNFKAVSFHTKDMRPFFNVYIQNQYIVVFREFLFDTDMDSKLIFSTIKKYLESNLDIYTKNFKIKWYE